MNFADNKSKYKTVAAIGKFDGVHLGHRELISACCDIAKNTGAKSLMYVVCPESGNRIMTDEEKEVYARELGIDIYYREKLTREYMSMTADEFADKILVEKLNCSHVVVGYNFRFAKNRTGDINILKKLCCDRNIEVTVIGEIKEKTADGVSHTVSSSFIRELLQEGRVAEIAPFLNRNYLLNGKVESGRQIGRKMGIPTANIIPFENIVLPSDGVYATNAEINKKVYRSITNIGTNPTVTTEEKRIIETNIFDFAGDIYSENIKITFLKKIRDEKKFESLDELKKQIEKDISFVLSFEKSF